MLYTQRAACIDQTGLTNKEACVSESRCCHISAVIKLELSISAALAVELLADFLQPAGRDVYQRGGSTDWLRGTSEGSQPLSTAAPSSFGKVRVGAVPLRQRRQMSKQSAMTRSTRKMEIIG